MFIGYSSRENLITLKCEICEKEESFAAENFHVEGAGDAGILLRAPKCECGAQEYLLTGNELAGEGVNGSHAIKCAAASVVRKLNPELVETDEFSSLRKLYSEGTECYNQFEGTAPVEWNFQSTKE